MSPSRGLGHFLCSVVSTHSFSSRLWLAPLYCCCPWWLSHSTDISKIAGVFLQLGCTLTNRLSSWYQVSTSPHDSFIPGPSTATETGPSLMASLGFSQRKPQLLSVTPSCLQDEYHLGDYYITKFCCQYKIQLSQFWNTVSLFFQETLLRRFYLDDADLNHC